MDGDSRVTDLKVHHLKAAGEIGVSILSTDVWRDPRHLFWVQTQQLKGSHYANMTSEFQHLIEIMQLALSWCNYSTCVGILCRISQIVLCFVVPYCSIQCPKILSFVFMMA